MMRRKDEFENYVEHPRYGKRPRITGLNPETDYLNVFLHWHSREDTRIPNTAIKADLTKQPPATVAVTHYFNAKRTCRDCDKPFIFFAEEQKHWYEELGFGLDSDCVRCPVCRKRQQGLARAKERYEELFHTQNRNDDQNLEMAECCLTLIENKVFHLRQTEHVRLLLKQASEKSRLKERYTELTARLHQLETMAN
jgi:hypothetical protein